MENISEKTNIFHRYHIDTRQTPDLVSWPNKFLVKVNRYQLARLLIQEVFHQHGDLKAITSRPCMYGTFSGPIGGFAPRPQHCVGCLRCTTQHPQTVTILRNPRRASLGDSYFEEVYVNAVAYEAETGSIPVKGAGYRGKFGGEGWDSMWTDMSEIVRPTRDGIHGREFISTAVDIGERPRYLVFNENGQPIGSLPKILTIPVPFLFDFPAVSNQTQTFVHILSAAARAIQSLVICPVEIALDSFSAEDDLVIPLIKPDQVPLLASLKFHPRIIEIDAPDSQDNLEIASLLERLYSLYPDSLPVLRTPVWEKERLLGSFQEGIRLFHLVADYHGRGPGGEFILDLIRKSHLTFVEAGVREEVTLIGGGGIIAAEHVPKAIICGLDLVTLETPLLIALQAKFHGECADRGNSEFILPEPLNQDWGIQRLKNLTAAWRDQLLEILGAMGIREVRRLRGEIGRAMFQDELEREAFAEIDGYE